MHINNLYKDKSILEFNECYALEKIHGTSVNIRFSSKVECGVCNGDGYVGVPEFKVSDCKQCKQTGTLDNTIKFFSGGEKYERFIHLFNQDELLKRFITLKLDEVVVYGEAYGGKQQGMSKTYGTELKFIAFEVKVGTCWLTVPRAKYITDILGLEFVHYVRIPTTLESLNAERDKGSVQSERNGISGYKQREGIVLRPLEEYTRNNGSRVIVKYKSDNFRETKNRRVVSEQDLIILKDAKRAAEEWTTEMRLTHVLDQFPDADITYTGKVIHAMTEDIKRESEGEVIWTHSLEKEIGKVCAIMFKRRIQSI